MVLELGRAQPAPVWPFIAADYLSFGVRLLSTAGIALLAGAVALAASTRVRRRLISR